MASSARRSELSRALLEGSDEGCEGTRGQPHRDAVAGSAPGGFLGLESDDSDGEEENRQSKNPVIMGSPFPYFFGQQKAARRKSHEITRYEEPMDEEEEGQADGPQPSKLVRTLVAASFAGGNMMRMGSGLGGGGNLHPTPSGESFDATTSAVRRQAAKRVHRRPSRQSSVKGGAGGKGGAASDQLSKALIIGMVNVVVGVPALISYTAIIFQAPEFKTYVGELAQLLFLASAIIQAVFCLRSTLPFAVGQVQDVGLIFLSAIATSVAEICSEAKLPGVEIVGTTLVTCLLATLFVGIMTIVVGKFKLAGLVQYIPLPVVGGYLGYVGFFCLVAGAAVSTNMPLDSPHDVLELLRNREAMYMLAAACASMVVLLIAMEKFQHPAALPAALVLVPATFHLVLLASGHSLHDAQESGWVIKPAGSTPFWEVFRLYNVHDWKMSGTYWPAVVRQVPKIIALFFVVAFGSSMDVAAIQQDMPEPLDFDGELVTVGLANILTSVCCAGFTGSYIFSQTIFTKRQGVFSAVNGWVIAIAELALFLLPVSVVEYMPNFFYGALLMVFGVDISRDWLVHSFSKVTHMEYALLLATFFAVVLWGLEIGIMAGIVLATFYFAWEYAKIRVTTTRVVPSSSGALRTFRQQAVVDMFSARMAAIGLEGYIFFGAALKIGERCMEVAERLAKGGGAPEEKAVEKLFSGDTRREQALEALGAAPKFLLLDFRQVEGLDATAARTFGTIANQLHSMRIDLIITGVQKASTRSLLVAHGAIPEENCDYGGTMALTFATMDAGAEFCEECFLQVAVKHGLVESSAQRMSLPEILRSNLEAPRLPLPPGVDLDKVATDLQAATEERTLRHKQVLFTEGEPSEELFIILRGSLRLSFHPSGLMSTSQRSMHNLGPEQHGGAKGDGKAAQDHGNSSYHRVFEFGPGGFVGDYDFYLRCPRSFRAAAGSYGCTVLALSRAKFDELLIKKPLALNVLQTIIVRSVCINEQHSISALGDVQGDGAASDDDGA